MGAHSFFLFRRDCHIALLPAPNRRRCTAFDHLQADAFWQADQAPGRVHMRHHHSIHAIHLSPATYAPLLRGQRATHGPWCGHRPQEGVRASSKAEGAKHRERAGHVEPGRLLQAA